MKRSFYFGNVKLEVFGIDEKNDAILKISDIDELAENVFVSVLSDGVWIDAGTLDSFVSTCMTEEEIIALEDSEHGISYWLYETMKEIESLKKETIDMDDYNVKNTVGRKWTEVCDMDWSYFYPVVSRSTGIVMEVVSAEDVSVTHEYSEQDEVYYTE